jgi:hypothetical protein
LEIFGDPRLRTSALPYAQKVKIALAEKGIPFKTHLPEGFGSGAVQDRGFTAENERHEVPRVGGRRREWMLRSGGLPIVLEGMEKRTIRFSDEIA